jgi:hypothetical protein
MTIHSFHAKNDHHRSASTWQMLLQAAGDDAEVVRVARDFVASFTPHEIELLPRECRPTKLVDGGDIATYGYDLAMHRWDEENASTPVVQAFARFFADASERLAQIGRRKGAESRESA